MTGRNKRVEKADTKPTAPPKADHPVERDPAVEWGERIATSKDIARGGKKKGFVPGASEQSTDAKPTDKQGADKK